MSWEGGGGGVNWIQKLGYAHKPVGFLSTYTVNVNSVSFEYVLLNETVLQQSYENGRDYEIK